jgi:hypothetical protein
MLSDFSNDFNILIYSVVIEVVESFQYESSWFASGDNMV